MHPEQGNPAHATNDTKRCARYPLARTLLLISLLTRTNDYLLVTDTFSKYPFTYKMHKKTAETVIHKFTQLFSQYSTPNTISTNNGPPFNSEPFTKFLIEQRVEHITSSPHYPKSNGFIERQVKTMKTALATATASRKTLDDVLLSIRSTPKGPNLPSPREILHKPHGRKDQGQTPHAVDYEEIRNYFVRQEVNTEEVP